MYRPLSLYIYIYIYSLCGCIVIVLRWYNCKTYFKLMFYARATTPLHVDACCQGQTACFYTRATNPPAFVGIFCCQSACILPRSATCCQMLPCFIFYARATNPPAFLLQLLFKVRAFYHILPCAVTCSHVFCHVGDVVAFSRELPLWDFLRPMARITNAGEIIKRSRVHRAAANLTNTSSGNDIGGLVNFCQIMAL